ncbi:MAG TPA: EamA family transporter [Desulfuromonadales bacterium]|nr:EamA family transporter [Desulfuromonadales bacterium]
MLWAVFAALTAVFESIKDVLGKRGVQRDDAVLVAWAWRLFALPFLLPALFFIDIPEIESPFWWALLVSGGLNVLTSVLYIQALKASDLSVTVPMVSFSPLFLLLTSPLILGEQPAPMGMTGVLLIVLGSYLLHIGRRSEGPLIPFKALLSERGPRLMLVVALIWSVTANVDKIGLQASSPIFWTIAVNLFIAVVLLPLGLPRLYRRPKSGGIGVLFALGFTGALGYLCQMTAISIGLVPYVIAIKRTSIVLSVGWGGLFFGEKGIRERLTGAAVMLAGVLCITLWG